MIPSDGARVRLIHLVWLLFALIALQALFSVPKLSQDLLFGETSLASVLLALAATAGGALVIGRYSGWLADRSRREVERLMHVSTARWIFLCIVTGVALRALWAFLFPVPLKSDEATYFALASNLTVNGVYQIPNGGYAYWPPGYPFLLSVLFQLFGIQSWVPTLANLLLYAGTILVVHRLALRVSDRRVAQLAVLLLVFWPTYVTSAGLALKETLVTLLLALLLLLYLGATKAGASTRKKSFLLLVSAGVTLGYASLTQPSLMLFPSVLLLYEWLHGEKFLRSFFRPAIVGLAMVLVVLPWTLRNHRVLHAWVPISTNGGDVFYRANNPLATGGYMPHGAVSLEHLDELQRNERGFQLGKQWIRANPQKFFVLALRKQTLFLGDDSLGVYETLKRGLGIGDIRYSMLKGLCNAYWWGLWVLILATLRHHWKTALLNRPEICALMLSFVYLYFLHSVFESNAKYHAPLIAIVAVLASLLVYKGDSCVREG